MRTFTIFLFLGLSLGTFVYSQGCSKFYPMDQGAMLEYTNYNKKGKTEGITSYKVEEVGTTGDTTNAVMKVELKDEKGKEIYTSDYKLSCTENTVTLDYESLLSNDLLENYREMEMEITGNDIEIPNNLAVGQELKDANVTMKIAMGGINMNISVDMTNRKVENMEDITTPAGTFSCYVLYSESRSKIMMANQTVPSRQWLSEGVGLIKQETYKKNGDLISSMVLTKFSK